MGEYVSQSIFLYDLSEEKCNGMQGLYALLTRGVHQNRAHFSKTIDLRGYMPRFTLKMNVFPPMSLETPEMCVETLRTVLIFPRRLI